MFLLPGGEWPSPRRGRNCVASPAEEGDVSRARLGLREGRAALHDRLPHLPDWNRGARALEKSTRGASAKDQSSSWRRKQMGPAADAPLPHVPVSPARKRAEPKALVIIRGEAGNRRIASPQPARPLPFTFARMLHRSAMKPLNPVVTGRPTTIFTVMSALAEECG